MKMTNAELAATLDTMSTKMVEAVRGYVDKVKDAIGARVDAVEKAIAGLPTPEQMKGLPGEPGQPGASVTLDDVKPLVAEAVAAISVPKGDPGEPGKPGDPGTPGKDAVIDEAALAAAVEGHVKAQLQDALEELPPPPAGPKGEDGKDGINGKDADPELVRAMVREEVKLMPVPRDGKDVDVAAVALMVDAAVTKAVANFRDGVDGRDALELEILPAIAEGKRYERGTWARHGGGLVKSFRDTNPLVGDALQEAGWEIMVNGVREVDVEQGEDLRTFVFGIRATDGTIAHKTFELPVVLDRGVYDPEQTYKAGDSISWDGCSWICQKETNQAPKRVHGEWRLSVKKGRDGNDWDSPKKAPTGDVVRLK